MARVIKYESERERILEYVRNPQESINPEDSGGSHYVDPAAILAKARATAESKVEEAYAEGLRRGEAAGQAQFEEMVGNASQMLDGVAQSLQEQHAAFIDGLENQMVSLCALITARILEREASADTQLVHQMVRRALERLSLEKRVRVRVNPNDYEAIILVKPEMQEQYGRIEQLEVIPDESVETGGCVAESDALFVDAQLTSQLTEVIGALHTADDEPDMASDLDLESTSELPPDPEAE